MRIDGSDLRFEPRQTGFDFPLRRCFVQPSFTSRFPLEVFHGICDVHLCARDASDLECSVEQSASGSDEWVTFDILTVTRLFPDHEERSVVAPFAKYCLGAGAPQRTRAARRSCAAQLR
jgi:hypothetical protein